MHQEQLMNDKHIELAELRLKMEEQMKQNEALNMKLNEISTTNKFTMKQMNQNHEKELQDLHTLLDKVSVEFNSLKSSTNGTPKNEKNEEEEDQEQAPGTETNEVIESLSQQLQDEKSKSVHLEFQSIVHQQLSSKVQEVNSKLQTQFNSQRNKYKQKIESLETENKKLIATINENKNIAKKYTEISELYQKSQSSLQETMMKYNNTKQENETQQQKITQLTDTLTTNKEELEIITTSYKQLLSEINPIQQQHKELTVQYDLITRAYQETRDEFNAYKKETSHRNQQNLTDIDTINKLKLSISQVTQQLESTQHQNKTIITV